MVRIQILGPYSRVNGHQRSLAPAKNDLSSYLLTCEKNPHKEAHLQALLLTNINMKVSIQIISTVAVLCGVSLAAPYFETRSTSTTTEASLPQPPPVPYTISDSRAPGRFLRATNYTSAAISSYAMMPCMLSLGQIAIAHVDNGLPLNGAIPVPHGFQCTNNTVNLIVNENPRMTYDELNLLSYLLLDWQQNYVFLGMNFEYGIDNETITTGRLSTQKLSDSG